MLGLALSTKPTPDVKEAYGKIKKEENVNDGKCSNAQSSSKQKLLVVKFNNVAFVEEHGERFWFFRTHVIPGNVNMLPATPLAFCRLAVDLHVAAVTCCCFLCSACLSCHGGSNYNGGEISKT